jgi:ATP-binding cassette subfamily B protein
MSDGGQTRVAHAFIQRAAEEASRFWANAACACRRAAPAHLIARALKNSPLLLLDETTSALDAERAHGAGGARIDTGTHITGDYAGLATVKKTDRIVVIDHGRIDQWGSRATDVAANQVYARLAALQFVS